MANSVFNDTIGTPYSFTKPNLTRDQRSQILSGLFEQLLLFDEVIISINRLGFALEFLLTNIHINVLEELIEGGTIKFLLWSPMIFTTTGTQRNDGMIDESTIYGRPPLIAGTLSSKDLDPEKNISLALQPFTIHADRKKIFKNIALKQYIVPDGMFYSQDSTRYIIDAYESNSLADLGLPADTEPEQMNLLQRQKLLELGNDVLKTMILGNYNLKGLGNYNQYKIRDHNLKNVGNALAVTDNVSEILKLQNIPNFKNVYLNGNVDFKSAIRIRNTSNAKYFRDWINKISQNCDAQEISAEYIKEIKSGNRFFETQVGKLFRTFGVWGMGAALGSAIASVPAGLAASLGLGLFDNFLLEKIIKGKNPSMFLDEVKNNLT